MAIETPKPVRGTQDIFGAEAEAFAHIVETFERVRRLYRFRRVEMPVFERTEVFSRSLGETTDVVSKEMYSFLDRGGESLTLRPEFTAGIARAYLTDGWRQYAPLKLATHGPLFRYERPQKGRYRQFHQLDAEIIGAAEPQADVELLAMADQLLQELGVADGVVLQLNTLGDAASRDKWRAALIEHFRSVAAELSEDSQQRLEHNPLRILDSKDVRDRLQLGIVAAGGDERLPLQLARGEPRLQFGEAVGDLSEALFGDVHGRMKGFIWSHACSILPAAGLASRTFEVTPDMSVRRLTIAFAPLFAALSKRFRGEPLASNSAE